MKTCKQFCEKDFLIEKKMWKKNLVINTCVLNNLKTNKTLTKILKTMYMTASMQ